jgi:hypothetical protein
MITEPRMSGVSRMIRMPSVAAAVFSVRGQGDASRRLRGRVVVVVVRIKVRVMILVSV